MREKANPTPGPWKYTDDGYVTAGETYIHEPNNLGREVIPGEIIPAEALANARLIAAAPALLAAAEAALAVWSVNPSDLLANELEAHYSRLVKAISDLRAAINLAKEGAA